MNLLAIVSSLILVVAAAVSAFGSAPSISLLTPDGTAESRSFADRLRENLSEKLAAADFDLSAAAFRSVHLADSYNLSVEESRRVGAAAGTSYFVLVKAGNLRRTSFAKDLYFEAYAAVYLVSSRSGKLLFWALEKREDKDSAASRVRLLERAKGTASLLLSKIEAAESAERTNSISPFPPVPEAPTKDFRAPIPYRRISPTYTEQAFLFSIAGTVDVEADIDEHGNVAAVEVTRWLGYGLDESVINAVRSMNWRPAERSGKPLAMRVLLRYNFKKVEKD